MIVWSRNTQTHRYVCMYICFVLGKLPTIYLPLEVGKPSVSFRNLIFPGECVLSFLLEGVLDEHT